MVNSDDPELHVSFMMFDKYTIGSIKQTLPMTCYLLSTLGEKNEVWEDVQESQMRPDSLFI